MGTHVCVRYVSAHMYVFIYVRQYMIAHVCVQYMRAHIFVLICVFICVPTYARSYMRRICVRQYMIAHICE